MFSTNLFINKNLCEKISEKSGRKFHFFINFKRKPLDSSSNGKKWFSTFKYTKIRTTGNSFTKLLFYTSRKKNRQKRGGILIYLINYIKFKIIKHLFVSDGNNECATVDIEYKSSKMF